MFCRKPWKVLPQTLEGFSKTFEKVSGTCPLQPAAPSKPRKPESSYFASKYFVNISIWGRSFV